MKQTGAGTIRLSDPSLPRRLGRLRQARAAVISRGKFGDLLTASAVGRSRASGVPLASKAVLIMKALGGQWLAWADQAQEDRSRSTEESIVRF